MKLCATLQMRVVAIDTGFPAQNSSNEARVIIRVTRNQRTPRFERSSYRKAIPETLAVGGTVIDIKATDNDPAVS